MGSGVWVGHWNFPPSPLDGCLLGMGWQDSISSQESWSVFLGNDGTGRKDGHESTLGLAPGNCWSALHITAFCPHKSMRELVLPHHFSFSASSWLQMLHNPDHYQDWAEHNHLPMMIQSSCSWELLTPNPHLGRRGPLTTHGHQPQRVSKPPS